MTFPLVEPVSRHDSAKDKWCGSAEVSVGMLLLVTVAQDKAASLCRRVWKAGDAGIISLACPLASRRCA